MTILKILTAKFKIWFMAGVLDWKSEILLVIETHTCIKTRFTAIRLTYTKRPEDPIITSEPLLSDPHGIVLIIERLK